MLDIRQLRLSRNSGFQLEVADWSVSSGELHVVLGTNGSGKSTLLRLFSGEETPDEGEVRLYGRNLQDWNSTERARHLALLPQASSMNFAFTAEEVVSLGLTPLSLGWRDARSKVHDVMRLVDCLHLAQKDYPNLSGGERQRVHLARVLVQLSQAERPPVLLLDEPTSAQDLGQQHRLLSLSRELAREQGYGVVAILHDLNLALRYADQCLLLDAGRVVVYGSPSQVINQQTIRRYWGYSATFLHGEEGVLVVA